MVDSFRIWAAIFLTKFRINSSKLNHHSNMGLDKRDLLFDLHVLTNLTLMKCLGMHAVNVHDTFSGNPTGAPRDAHTLREYNIFSWEQCSICLSFRKLSKHSSYESRIILFCSKWIRRRKYREKPAQIVSR